MTTPLRPRRVTNEDRYPWLLTRFHPRVWHYRHNSNRDKPRRALAFHSLASASACAMLPKPRTRLLPDKPAYATKPWRGPGLLGLTRLDRLLGLGSYPTALFNVQ